MDSTPRHKPRAADRRKSGGTGVFPAVLPNGTTLGRDRRLGDRRRNGFISRVQLFSGVAYSAIEDVIQHCTVHDVRTDTLLLDPGRPNTSIFLVLEGRMRVHLDAADSPNSILIEAGDCIGEMSIIDGRPVSAFVVAEKGSRILALEQEQFWSRFMNDPRVVRNLLALMSERMRLSNDKLLEGFKQRLKLEHIEKELRLAREIQESMLPRPAALAALAGALEVHARIEPAREVGGDLYDFFVTPQGTLCMAVGDVSGKGVPAALFMARTVDLLRVTAKLSAVDPGGDPDPARIMARVNEELCRNNDNQMFVTLFLAFLNPRSGQLRFCNAGHNPPYVRGGDARVRPVEGGRSAPLGVRVGTVYRDQTLTILPDEVLFAYTDGVTEAADPRENFFGEERLEHVLRGTRLTSVAALAQEVLEAVHAFAGGAAPSDDITVLAVRRLPQEMR
ncbi:MAG: SpoIIE family protein phosphatase [Betaproteobacteria bacterium]|nr:SpoIIE family protein phosphatase [Betaproteobacteria bacterium]